MSVGAAVGALVWVGAGVAVGGSSVAVGAEVALGSGDVDWDAYIAALEGIGFGGFYTIEREVGENPAQDIQVAAEFLRRF